MAQCAIVLQFSLFVVAGVGLLSLAVADLRHSRDADSCLLALWTVGTFVFCWIFNWTVNARSILPMAPAVSILIVRAIGRRAMASAQRASSWEFVPLLPLGILALAVARADTQLANAGRSAAEEFHDRYGGRSDVFFAGHWGFQYYMESYGFRPVDVRKTAMTPGDLLILPQNNSFLPTLSDDFYGQTAVLERTACPVLATMNSAVGAGFYADGWGPLPFAAGAVPKESYRVMAFLSPKQATRQDNSHDAVALNNLAWLLATREPADGGDPDQAVRLAKRACELTDGKSPSYLDTLAAAYAAAGRFDEAVATAEKARAAALAGGQTASAKRIEARLELYRLGRAYREPAPPPSHP